MRILVVEDEPETGRAVRDRLERAGHHVRLVADGLHAAAVGSSGGFDVAVVDRSLPRRDGLAVMRTWRSAGISTAVLLLTAMGSVDERIEGLTAGADDYLTKPFDAGELLARIEVLGRRRATDAEAVRLQAGHLKLDLVRRTCTVGEAMNVILQPRECSILALLMRNVGSVVTRTMLLREVWGYGFDPGTNIVESHMSRLRSKISAGADVPIETLRGLGYMLRDR